MVYYKTDRRLTIFYGYAEISSIAILTTKRTKDTKREDQFTLPFLRDLRVLRGEITQN